MFMRVAPTPSTSSSTADSKQKGKTGGEAANVRRAPRQSGYLVGVLKPRKVNLLSTTDVPVAGAVDKTRAQARARRAVPFGRRVDGNEKQGLSTWHSLPEALDGVMDLQGEEDTVVVSRQALATKAPAQAPGLIDEDEVVEAPPPQATIRIEAARPPNRMAGQAKTSRRSTGPMKQTTLSFSKPKG